MKMSGKEFLEERKYPSWRINKTRFSSVRSFPQDCLKPLGKLKNFFRSS